MIFREAQLADIPGMQRVRNSVLENKLSNPALISYEDYENFISVRGNGWICEEEGIIIGFSVADLTQNNVWALFVSPGAEGRGIGRELLRLLLQWYFIETRTNIWLSTAPQTRAEQFYRKAGWKEVGMQGNEIKFEMTFKQWDLLRLP